MVIAAACIWGSYGGFVKRFASNAPYLAFMCAFQLAQIIVTLIIVLPRYQALQLNSEIYGYKYANLVLSGSFILWSEFFYVASTKTLSSVTTTLWSNAFSDLCVSILISQFIDGHGVNVFGLLISSALYCMGLFFFAKADFVVEKLCDEAEEEGKRSVKAIKQLKIKEKRAQMRLAMADVHLDSSVHSRRRPSIGSEAHGSEYSRRSLNSVSEAEGIDISAIEESLSSKSLFDSRNNKNESKLSDDTNAITSSRGYYGVSFVKEDVADAFALPTHLQILSTEITDFSFCDVHSTRKTFTEIFDDLNDSFRSARRASHRTSFEILGHRRTIFKDMSSVSVIDTIKPHMSTMSGISFALFSGLMMGMFTITSAIAMTGEGAITGWETAFLLNQLGQFVTVPILVLFFGFWDPFNAFPPEDKITNLKQLTALSRFELFVALSLGTAVTLGYGLIYVAASSVPFAIIDGLLTGETLVSYVFAYFIWDEFNSPKFLSTIGLCTSGGIITYIAAMIVVVFYANSE